MKFENGGPPITDSGNSNKLPLLYIHIPFCEKLCPYCSFHRVVFDSALCRDYFKALRKEIMLYKGKGFDFSGIYVGTAETLGINRTTLYKKMKARLEGMALAMGGRS